MLRIPAKSAFPDFVQSLAAELRRAAAEVPDHPFIRMTSGEWSYGQFNADSDRVAAGLHAQGVRRGDNVSLMLPNCIEFAVVWFALAKLGAVAAPVNTSFRGQVLLNAINLVESKLMVVHASLYEALMEARSNLQHIEQIVMVGGEPPEHCLSYGILHAVEPDSLTLPQPDIGFAELCLLLYTSGTTGRSKAAMISHRFVLAQAHLTILGLGLRADDVLYCPYPMFHLDAAVMTIAPALLLRGVAAIGEKFSVSRYWQEMREFKATVFDFMGATITMLWKQPASSDDRNHCARLGWGVPLPSWAPEFEARFGCQLVELYGLTEAGAMIFTPQNESRRLGSCGKPIGPFEVSLLDEDGFEVPVGQAGELAIRPLEPSLIMQGYYGMPEETMLAFRNLWFHTGDVLKRDADGFLYFVGRRKDIVRRRGENISAAEVEMVIETHPDVLECAVIGVPSEMTEEEVMACVVLRLDTTLDAPVLADFCAERMARFMVPRYVRFVDHLPKTPTDKVEKFRLQQEFAIVEKWDRENPTSSGSRTPTRKTSALTDNSKETPMKYAQLSTHGRVSVVTLNRPDRLNAIGGELLLDLHDALEEAQNDPVTGAIVLTGAGRAFCAGDDLKEFEQQAESLASIAQHCDRIQQITRDIMFGSKIVVGAVHGYAVGGGFEWALNCDMVVAADNLVCFFPEMALGHFVTGGVTHLLPQALGHQRTMELIVLGEHQSAQDLLQLGLINRVVAIEVMLQEAIALAEQVASRSAGATGRLKRLLNSELQHQLAGALEHEQQAAMACFADADTAQRVQSFAAKRL